MKKKKNILTNWQENYGTGLVFVDGEGDERECDFCDQIKPLASIHCLCGDVMCICQECLQIFANAFND